MDRPSSNFLREIVKADLESGRVKTVVTRFPPEPNGYLHIGHAKAICVDFGLAQEFGGRCHLRMDDTNPLKEDPIYVENIQKDVRWLGFDWGPHFYEASAYFQQLYDWAERLVLEGKAYVDDLSDEEIRAYRGTVTEPGKPSPFRDRSPAENLDLLRRMKAGEFADGSRVLRAKGDLANPNMKMRDPLMYRIRRVSHHAAGEWNIYPFYDYAHGLSDAIEGVTHSICTLEFENNRELYDWYLELVGTANRPRQFEFARLNMAYTMMSKRRLLKLVEEGRVWGWDDPRMPTLAGLRRKGVPAAAIREFCERIGVARAENLVDPAILDAAIRDELNGSAPRAMAVLRPLRVELRGHGAQTLNAPWFPSDVRAQGGGDDSARELQLGGSIWIEQDDFAESPPPGWKRLTVGGTVRLRHGPVIRCVEKQGDRLICEVVEEKAKGTIHWVPGDAPVAKVRLFEHLFTVERPDAEEDWLSKMNPASFVELEARVEPAVLGFAPGTNLQFERQGFFVVDPVDSAPGAPVFHRSVALKDSWAKSQAADAPKAVTKAEAPRAEVVKSRPEGAAALEAQGYPSEEADVLATAPALLALVEQTVAAGASREEAAKLVVHELRPLGTASAAHLAELLGLVREGRVTRPQAREVLAAVVAGEGAPSEIVAKRGLEILGADALGALVDAAIAEAPDKVAAYRGGRTGLLGFFVGAVMKKSGGKADPKALDALVRAKLG